MAAAALHALTSHGQPFLSNHLSTSSVACAALLVPRASRRRGPALIQACAKGEDRLVALLLAAGVSDDDADDKEEEEQHVYRRPRARAVGFRRRTACSGRRRARAAARCMLD